MTGNFKSCLLWKFDGHSKLSELVSTMFKNEILDLDKVKWPLTFCLRKFVFKIIRKSYAIFVL